MPTLLLHCFTAMLNLHIRNILSTFAKSIKIQHTHIAFGKTIGQVLNNFGPGETPSYSLSHSDQHNLHHFMFYPRQQTGYEDQQLHVHAGKTHQRVSG